MSDRSMIQMDAKRTMGIVTVFTSILIAALIALNIYQFAYISELRVYNEKVKTSVFLETSELVIEKYWLERLGIFQKELGKELVKTNGLLANALDVLEIDYSVIGFGKEKEDKGDDE